MITIIAAVGQNRVIGNQGALPWDLPTDLKFFRETTRYCPVLMGRKTFESIGHPLKDRTNVVITRQKSWEAEGVITASSLPFAIGYVAGMGHPSELRSKIFVIGGEQIYKEALPFADELLITDVDANPEGDAFFPMFDHKNWDLIKEGPWLQDSPDQPKFRFLTMRRIG